MIKLISKHLALPCTSKTLAYLLPTPQPFLPTSRGRQSSCVHTSNRKGLRVLLCCAAGILEPLFSSLLHPCQSSRVAAAWCLRCVATSVPSLLAPLIDRCLARYVLQMPINNGHFCLEKATIRFRFSANLKIVRSISNNCPSWCIAKS